ncbi:MAG: hypothetical protein LC794_09930 [Acidobacteria bacterium]|nr:hypothetical protein [Acidobacteriota bacterium]
MKRLHLIVGLVLLMVLLAAAWFWLATPAQVDLADYAAADALVYVEFNDLADVARAIRYTDVWKAAAPITQSQPRGENRLLIAAARAGVAPIESVLFTRAQVALVVLGLNTSEQDDTLKVKPEVAVIAETHTTQWRTKPAAVEAVKRLADFAYGASTCTERSGDADYVECSANAGERKLIGAVDGTLVILGNSDNAVRSCLEVRRGARPSIRTDAEFLRSRSSVMTQQSLGFGYISSANSAKLFSWAAPLLMGMAPGDQQVQQLLAVSAGKILRGIAWTAVPAGGGIEDRFLFSLEPGVIARLQPAFETSERDEDIWKMVPGSFQSLTIYRSREPAAAWSSLDSAVALKLDALPAVLFGSLLKSSLLVYGISNPKEALAALSPPLLTMKPPAGAEGSVLIARVSDEARLRKSLQEDDGYVVGVGRTQILEGLQAEPDPAKEFAAVFADGYVIVGKTENMRPALTELRKGQATVTEEKKSVQDSARESTAAIVTYSNDEARLTNFISTLVMLQGRRLTSEEFAQLQNTVGRSSFAASETRLGQAGIERRTRSAFGQFSTFTSLLQPDGGGSVARVGPVGRGDWQTRVDSVARRQ